MITVEAWRAWIGPAVVRIALVVVAVIAFAATARLGELVSQSWSAFPGDLGMRGVVFLFALLIAGAGTVAAARRLPAGGEKCLAKTDAAAIGNGGFEECPRILYPVGHAGQLK